MSFFKQTVLWRTYFIFILLSSRNPILNSFSQAKCCIPYILSQDSCLRVNTLRCGLLSAKMYTARPRVIFVQEVFIQYSEHFIEHLLFLFWNSGHIGNKSRTFYWIFILTLYYEFLYNRIFFRILYYEINNVTLRLITNIYEKVRLSKILFQSI